MTQPLKVLVAGGGIAGLTAALCLLDSGVDVTVLERAAKPQEVGAGLQVSANAVRVLSRLGLQQTLEQLSGSPAGKVFRLWNTGETWEVFRYSKSFQQSYGFPHLTLYRPDLHRVLMQALAERNAGALRTGAEIVGVGQSETSVKVRLGDGSVLAGDLLVGADGVHSLVRESIIAKDSARYSGCMAWRGVVEMDQLPARLRTPVATGWMGPGGHAVHYPLRSGELMNFVGIVERPKWSQESWTAEGTRAECLRDLEGWHDDVRTIADALPRHLLWAMMVRDPLPRWSQGRVTLMGDAAHAMLPFLSQGSAQAIEDAFMLARCLAENHNDVAPALTAYEQARVPRANRIVQESAANMARFHSPKLATPQGAAEYFESELAGATRANWDWIYAYDVETTKI